jgi:site-specific DNA recombinase
MKIVSYCRVSSEGQVKEGVSLEAQEARVKAWAAERGHDLVETFVDAGISGKRMSNRPALLKALDLACKLKGVLVVYSLSRVSRSVKDSLAIVERLHKAGADLVSLSEAIDTTSASGKLTFQLFISLAEHERNLISERTRSALSHLKAMGKRTGTVPYGYSLLADGKTLRVNAKEQRAIESMQAMRKSGKSYWEIAKTLNADGVPTKKSGQWSAGSALRILRGSVLAEEIAA